MADTPQPGAPAAQDDVLGGAARNRGTMEGLDPAAGNEGTPRDRGQGNAGENGEARPGRDENQAGFVKDGDKRFSP